MIACAFDTPRRCSQSTQVMRMLATTGFRLMVGSQNRDKAVRL
jgi:hypothetical protein